MYSCENDEQEQTKYVTLNVYNVFDSTTHADSLFYVLVKNKSNQKGSDQYFYCVTNMRLWTFKDVKWDSSTINFVSTANSRKAIEKMEDEEIELENLPLYLQQTIIQDSTAFNMNSQYKISLNDTE